MTDHVLIPLVSGSNTGVVLAHMAIAGGSVAVLLALSGDAALMHRPGRSAARAVVASVVAGLAVIVGGVLGGGSPVGVGSAMWFPSVAALGGLGVYRAWSDASAAARRPRGLVELGDADLEPWGEEIVFRPETRMETPGAAMEGRGPRFSRYRPRNRQRSPGQLL